MNRHSRIIGALLVLAALTVVAGCAAGRAALRDVTAGSCQQACQDRHPDSLYDRNRCLETCEAP